MVYIISSSKEQRRHHWQEIKKTIRTHEGELLTGSKGRDYQQKYSKKYLGKDLSGLNRCEGADYDKILDQTTQK